MFQMLWELVVYSAIFHYSVKLLIWAWNLFAVPRFSSSSSSQAPTKGYQVEDKSWAVVTGATSGIGLAFVKELARDGWNVLLVSRSQAKLEAVKADLENEFPAIEFDCFALDAGDAAKEINRKLWELKEIKLVGRDVGALINNVGVVEDTFGWFGDWNLMERPSASGADDETAMDDFEYVNGCQTARINCVFPSKLTNFLLPLLKDRHPTPSFIVNVSSVLAHLPSPFSPIYGASKAYNRTFSRALAAEYQEHGIDVLCISPGMVATNLTGLQGSSWLWCDAAQIVRNALSSLGSTSPSRPLLKSLEIFPHPSHATLIALATIPTAWLLPSKFVSILAAAAMRFLPKPPGIKVAADFKVEGRI